MPAYALGGLLEVDKHGRFLFAFVFSYLGHAALRDRAVAIVGDLQRVLPAEVRAGECAAMSAVRQVETDAANPRSPRRSNPRSA